MFTQKQINTEKCLFVIGKMEYWRAWRV